MKMMLIYIQVNNSLSGGEKNAKGSSTSVNHIDGNQVDGAILPPTPPIVQFTGVNEMKGVEKTGITKSFPHAKMIEIGKLKQPTDMSVAQFSP